MRRTSGITSSACRRCWSNRVSDLTDLTVRECMEAMEAGEVSSWELTRACLARVEALESDIHAFITLMPEKALADARAADERRAALKKLGQPAPPLLGLPMAIKDVLCVAGMHATCGSRILENYVSPFNATAVQKLLDAGMVVLGKTNTDEFAMGSSTENSAFGVTHNPWDRERVPGGSSGGSAAAVAARFAPAALGTDTGGSVRQPAAFCGITGIKPTYGRVSRFGLIAYGSSLDTVGVLARSAADAALILWLMAGFDELDSTSSPQPLFPPACEGRADIAALRIGVPAEYFIEGIQPEVEAAVRAAIAVFKSLGAQIEQISMPHTAYAVPVYYLISPAEASANLARYDGVRFGLRVEEGGVLDMFMKTRGRGFGAEVKRRIMLGTYALSSGYYDAYYGQAQRVRRLIRADFERAFEQVDVIAAPVAPSTAFPIGGHGDDPLAMYLEDAFTLPANLAGVPALAFPVGFDQAGLPVGMQLMGRHFGEATLFQMACAFQKITDWHTRSPML